MWVERRCATSRTILHALSIPFCWLDAEEPRKDSEALWDSRATRRQKTRFLIITSQKLIRRYVVRNELHCIKLLRFGACYSIWPSLTNMLRSLADCWFRLWISRESSPFLCKSKGLLTSYLLQAEQSRWHFCKIWIPTLGLPIYSSMWAKELAPVALGLLATSNQRYFRIFCREHKDGGNILKIN